MSLQTPRSRPWPLVWPLIPTGNTFGFGFKGVLMDVDGERERESIIDHLHRGRFSSGRANSTESRECLGRRGPRPRRTGPKRFGAVPKKKLKKTKKKISDILGVIDRHR